MHGMIWDAWDDMRWYGMIWDAWVDMGLYWDA